MKIQEQFKKIVANHGQRIAISCEGREITYGELDERSDTLAEWLLNYLGERLEIVHGFYGLSEYFHIAALACAKANKVICNINPDQADSHIALQFDNTPSRLLLTTRGELARAVHLNENVSSVYLLDKGHSFLESRRPFAELGLNPDAMYLEFTSGSTGSKKCLLHTHESNLAQAQSDRFDLGIMPPDRVAQYRIGMSGYHIGLYGLLNGATLILRTPKESREGGRNFGAWINEEGITILPLLATTYRYLLGIGEKFLGVHYVELGGEPTVLDDFLDFKQSDKFSDDCVFVVRFALSEAHVVTRLKLTKQFNIAGRLPVGYPLPRVRILILDEEGKQLPAGKMGEIAVCSPMLSPGYFNNPELNKEKYKRVGDLRYYMTRDLGVLMPDGLLFHYGRKDFQGEIRAKFNAAAEAV